MPARKNDFDSKLIGEIAEIMAETGLTEVELRQGDSTLRARSTLISILLCWRHICHVKLGDSFATSRL